MFGEKASKSSQDTIDGKKKNRKNIFTMALASKRRFV
jgi:hypothetical protein